MSTNKKYLKRGDSYFEILPAGKDFDVFPAGGGKSNRMSQAEVDRLEQVDELPTEWVPGIFFFDDTPGFKGFHQPERRWNCSPVPAFPLDVCERIVECLVEFKFTRKQNGYLIVEDANEGSYFSADLEIVVDGKTIQVNPLGLNWTWNLRPGR